MNLANKLTIIRIFLVPIFLIFIAVKDIPYGKTIATAIFIIAALTDKLDGYIARSRNQITRFGKFMDPLADKLLVTAALISLVELQVISTWVAMVIIAREFAVTGLRAVAAAEGIVIAASPLGKAKTVTQIVAIVVALIDLNNINILSIPSNYISTLTTITMAAAVIITIISGIDYFVKNKEAIKIDK
ncbi:CDP-diacylglycerol--glycerol-3-phosphate 3-phosphatidyltransferase [Clostridium cochlearium]|jgi:CDP-diacylglycerol--glycerol-3-phosphate 3-phosphatidyltransferase|uniref:CDP-diacylglycerol--glycerol-3-phosphate 3-phosphatidyltransferase n=1 Tax=Clostridium cochlearium TaxID=1494 RepID=A0A239ZZ73_CLOCO|nr:CDP-diacylglycerol--glycerol-3-phosphate 3-phosphatidyltransferase [Clostridium cochlearium]MBV1820590.1 CDP-diacylglycerol--glycerol-3-phosphate 3-phosphatidyltransferase [Bacteroidales bacterium MSK.15.36]NSJ92105.1 CDP-diacylglycerol--glycerol-3-phosphate 3-phosphatidyltransferase [Coprococcus sp. MSK.21.13]MBE6064339.1 CDP-diacylglycerol--glycerol-3-phosphate 3-phosphatidyltransferase [Clostridium cochlearium]MCG4570857.1 CDP-diacylglycerol--glycerol-3-phosphate 3-phosphatidyltransferase